MKSVRRPAVAVGTTLVLVVIQAIADPTGLLALVGWSGAVPQVSAGVWPFAPYVVFVPVLFGVVWWAAVRAGDRFVTLAAGVTLAVLLAQAAATFVMTWNIGIAAWSAGYVLGKAIPAALIVAAITRWFGGRTERAAVTSLSFRSPALWLPAVFFAAVTPLVAGQWWAGAAYAPGVPVARPDSGILSVVIALALLAGLTAFFLRWMRPRVPGVLGGWLAALVAGGAVGVVQAVVAFAVDGGLDGDLWPLMAAYVTVADGLAFGATVGWTVGLGAVVADRVLAGRTERSSRVIVAAVAAAALVIGIVAPVTVGGSAASNSGTDADAPAAGFLRADGQIITDGNGNQVLLRGTNVNQLVDFYRPRSGVDDTVPLKEKDFEQIAEQGFNVVRLNLSWSALEPQRGAFDEDYLAQVSQAVDWAKKYDIYIVLDMHQDGWYKGATTESTECRPGTDPMWGYDGAPAWATLTDGAPRCQFTGRDISPAGNRAFQNFYFDTDGIQGELVNTWGKLAEVFKDEPTVAGYDLLNEPGFGETAPVTTSYQLGRFFDRSITAIRAAGAEQIVFVEPSIFWSGLGFDSGPPKNFTDDGNIVFSPHFYAESLTLDRSLGIPSIVSLNRQFVLAQRVAAQYNAPVWSGEYGYWGEEADVVAWLNHYAQLEDTFKLGSAFWVWKQACGDPQGGITDQTTGLMPQDCVNGGDAAPNEPVLEILGRAYPRSAPGVLTSLSADGATMALAGSTSSSGCGLDVWVPGDTEPQVDVTGITKLETTAVPGGWMVTGCADGDYTLSTKG